MRYIWLAWALAAASAPANPIFVESIPYYKEQAVVVITAGREQSLIEGAFHYRSDPSKASAGGRVGFPLRVPVFVPREGYGPASQMDMWSAHSNPQRSLGVAIQLQYSIGGPAETMRNCRITGAQELPLPLPENLRSSVDVVMCEESVVTDGGNVKSGVSLKLDYRQYNARARASGRMNLIYVPLFETRSGSRIDTTGRLEDFRVEVRATDGVSLRLISANKVITRTDTLLRVVPVHGEPIVVEIR